MELRPIRPEERALIEHLLSFVKQGNRFKIPQEVGKLGDDGIKLSTRGEHKDDLVEADYKDSDRRDVVITLTINQYDELYELDFWKTDFSSLQAYPEPKNVKRAK